MKRISKSLIAFFSIFILSILTYSNTINSISYRNGNIVVKFDDKLDLVNATYDESIPLLKIDLKNTNISNNVSRLINIQDKFVDTILAEQYDNNSFLLIYMQIGSKHKVSQRGNELNIEITQNMNLPKRNFTIVLDAGHGGKDSGAVGNGYKEKDLALDVVLELYKNIKRDYNVILTRNTDEFIALNERARIGNDHNANLFVSVHLNASKNRNANGAEVFYFSKNPSKYAQELAEYENSFDIEGTKAIESSKFIVEDILYGINQQQSASIADSVLDSIVASNGINKRKVAGANFAVLRGSNSPAILIELGFITNQEDVRLYTSKQGQVNVANAIANAIRKHF